MTAPVIKSIYDLTPPEQGGTANRIGINFQDHVAAEFCLDMLLGTELEEVWCETQDDITLIWKKEGTTVVEFVQVKSNVSFNAWSVANLCDRKKSGPGHSILEKSLANDRCAETCCFQIVTSQTVDDDLKVLTYGIDSWARSMSSDKLKTLDEALVKKVPDFQSPNGRDYKFWMENTKWAIKYDAKSIENQAIRKMRNFFEQEIFVVSEEQLEELYSQLVLKVHKAGLQKYEVDPQDKRIKKAELHNWLIGIATKTLHPVMGRSDRMQLKMEAAMLPEDTIEAAKEERRRYRKEILNPQYLSINELQLMEEEVFAQLHVLKSKLDTGTINLGGPEFHELCLERMEEIRKSLPTKSLIPLIVIHGNMYDIVNRCFHRFQKVVRRAA